MSPFLIAIFLTVGACTWIYNKFQRYTGGDTQRSAIATIAIGALIFLIANYFFGLIAG